MDKINAKDFQIGKPAILPPRPTPSSTPLLPPPKKKKLTDRMWADPRCGNVTVAEFLHVDPSQTFEALKNWPGQETAITAVRSVLSGKRTLVLLTGGTGSGKSHILNAACLELFRADILCPVSTFSDVLQELWATIRNKDGPPYAVVLDRFCTCKKPLIIDDVGMGISDTDKALQVFEEIVCARYRDRLPTIMATNLDISQLPPRVRSRFEDKTLTFLVNNKAGDYRPKLGVK